MDTCSCEGFASIFDREAAEGDRDRYRRAGPDRTTRMLLDLIAAQGVEDATVLDVGGGVGIIGQELLGAGARSVVLVDASVDYLAVAREEIDRLGLGERVALVNGDFVQQAAGITPADVVTLDRVVCCYGDMPSLVAESASRARRLYGLVLPRDYLLVRFVLWLEGVWFRVRRSRYRPYAHRNAAVDQRVADQGLHPIAERHTLAWRVVLYGRPEAQPAR